MTRLLLPNSCWPPGILSVVRRVRFARTLCLARISGCFWEQPPCYILGPRSRAGSRHAEWLCRTSCHSGRLRKTRLDPYASGPDRPHSAFHNQTETLLDVSHGPDSVIRWRSEERRVGKECRSGWAREP